MTPPPVTAEPTRRSATVHDVRWRCANCSSELVLKHPDRVLLQRAATRFPSRECWSCKQQTAELVVDRTCAHCSGPILGAGKGPGRRCCSYSCAGALKDAGELD